MVEEVGNFLENDTLGTRMKCGSVALQPATQVPSYLKSRAAVQQRALTGCTRGRPFFFAGVERFLGGRSMLAWFYLDLQST